jgi:hypothetical protein
MVQLFNTVIEDAFDSNGDPIPGAQLFVYEAGTTTKTAVYTDSALTTPATNPVVADSAGRFEVLYAAADNYRLVLAPANDTDPPTSPIRDLDDYEISATSSFSGGINAGGFTERLVNAQTGTSYTILSSDRAKVVTFTNASNIAVTLPQADSSDFQDGWYAYIKNAGNSLLTVTPTTSTIDGQSSLVIGTGQSYMIVSDGTNYISAMTAGTRILLQRQTASTSSSIDFTSGITTAFTDYELRISRLVPDTDGTGVYVRVGNGSFDTTNYKFTIADFTGTTASVTSDASANRFDFIDAAVAGTGTGETVNGNVYLFDAANASGYMTATWEGGLIQSDEATKKVTGSGNYFTNTAIDRVQVLMSSGNVASGTFSLYGIL